MPATAEDLYTRLEAIFASNPNVSMRAAELLYQERHGNALADDAATAHSTMHPKNARRFSQHDFVYHALMAARKGADRHLFQ